MLIHDWNNVTRECVAVIFFSMLLCTGCKPSEQTLAERALEGSDFHFKNCLKAVHWVTAKRRGAYRWSLLGAQFIDLTKPLQKPLSIDDFVYAPVPVGPDSGFFRIRPEAYELDYLKAGSPRAHPDAVARLLGFDERLFVIEKQYGLGSIRGEATGWLSRETVPLCAFDGPQGRFFLITQFKPAFPIRIG